MVHDIKEPYVGPRPFKKGEASIFFGRERAARDLLALVSSHRLVLFYAQSGAGKSSLINTKLVPGLEDMGFEVLPTGRVSVKMPTSDPGGKADKDYEIFVYSPESLNEDQQRRFDEKVSLIKDDYQPSSNEERNPTTLIIDQFEEIFTTPRINKRTQREKFFKRLHMAMKSDPWLWVLLSMREDYVAPMDLYAHLLPGGLRIRYYMERMRPDAALKAITEPVRKFAWEWDSTPAEELCSSLQQTREPGQEVIRNEFVEPVQLQVVCYQLWQTLNKDRDTKRITLTDLENQAEKAGGKSVAEFVDSALSQFYNQAVQAVAETTHGRTEADIRNWFGEELITPGNTRNLIFDDKIKVGSLDKDLVQKLDETYRLVRPEVRGVSNWYELTHDRFIQPIQHANQLWLENKPPIYHAAREWDQGGRKDYFLFTGERLDRTLKALDNFESDPSDSLIHEFIKACQRADSQREDDNRILMNYDRLIFYGAVLSGAALFGYIPITIALFVLSWFAAAGPAMKAIDEDPVINFLGLIILTLISIFVFASIGSGIGWFLKRNGYDWLRTRSVRQRQLHLFQDKLKKIELSDVLDRYKGE